MHQASNHTPTAPSRCYTVWFSQRVGSTVLCQALQDTGIAGRPGELFCIPNQGTLPAAFGAESYAALRPLFWERGMTANGVFGLKHGLCEPHFSWLISELRQLPGVSPTSSRAALWEQIFPQQRHIFMTRRHKVRLAVSWWKAICSGEWHRQQGVKPAAKDLRDRFDFAALDRLVNETVLREAAIQDFLREGGITPLTVTYEDLETDFAGQLVAVLNHLQLPVPRQLPQPALQRLADELTEEWVERYRQQKQRNWDRKVW